MSNARVVLAIVTVIVIIYGFSKRSRNILLIGCVLAFLTGSVTNLFSEIKHTTRSAIH